MPVLVEIGDTAEGGLAAYFTAQEAPRPNGVIVPTLTTPLCLLGVGVVAHRRIHLLRGQLLRIVKNLEVKGKDTSARRLYEKNSVLLITPMQLISDLPALRNPPRDSGSLVLVAGSGHRCGNFGRLGRIADHRRRRVGSEDLPNGGLQHLVAAVTNARDGRLHFLVGYNSYPLCGPFVRVEDADAADHGVDAAGQRNL